MSKELIDLARETANERRAKGQPSCAGAFDILADEIEQLRIKLYRQRPVEGCDHSTACSIWGDDGQGTTQEGWNKLPCNCGALLNFKQKQVERLEVTLLWVGQCP